MIINKDKTLGSAAFLVVFAVLVTAPLDIRAEPSGDDTTDQTTADSSEAISFSTLVERALGHYKSGDYSAAIRDLTAAHKRKSKARLLFNLGLAHKKSGHCAGALVYFRSYLEQDDTEAPLVKRAKQALETSDDCEAYSEDLAGRLTVYSSPSGATVYVDGEKRGTTPHEVVALSAGSHTVRLSHPDRASTEFEVDLTSGTDHEVEKSLPTAAEADADKQASGPSLADNFTPLKTTPMALGATGIGFLLTGMIADFALLTQTNRKLRVLPEGASLRSKYRTRRTTERAIAATGYIGGLALVGTGVAWQLLTSSPDDESTAWRIGLSPRGATLGVRF